MAAPLKISARVDIDAAGAKQGAAASVAAVDTIGTAAERNTTKLQALINASTGIGRGAANQSAREWTGALAMQGKSLDELRAKWNPLYATISQYRAAVTEIRTLHAQGTLKVDEMTAAIQRQRQAALASIGAIKGRGLALREEAANANVVAGRTVTGTRGFETANIAAQFQDIAVTSAMGMSPLQIALQQGTQLSAVIGSMERPVAGLLAALRSVFSWTSLLTIGLVAAGSAAIQYFTKADEEADKASRAIEAHGDLIRRLREAYGEAAVGASEYARESKKILQQDAADSARSYRSILTRTATDLIGGVTSVPVDDFEGATFIIQKMQGALAGLETSLAEGSPDIQAFVERLIEIENHGGASERIRELTEELRKAASEGLAAQRALGEISAFPARQRGFLLGSSTEQERLDYLDRQRLSLRQMQVDADARRTQLFARSPSERAEAARQAERARSIAGESAEENRLRIELAGKEALTRAEKELTDARDNRRRSMEETLGQQQLELSLIGQTIAEQERLRMEYRLKTELYAEAARTNTDVDQAELARVQALSAEYGRLAEQMTARRALDDQDQEIAALRVRLQLTGQSEEVRARAILQLETERRLREMGISLGSREAEQLRQKDELIARMNEQLRKQEAAWAKVRGTAENTIDTVLDRLMEGDFEGALADIAKDWSKTILQLGVANPLKNGLLGTNHETLGDIGGLGGMFEKLFGGGMSTSSMSVTAASVSVNGGVPGLGNLFSPANDNFSPTTTLGDLLGAGGSSRGGASFDGSGASLAWNFWKSKGLADHQVAGILGNIKAESAFNPLAVGDGGNAFGLYQHNDRRFRLFDAIGGKGNLRDELAQHRFAYSELMGPENRAWQSLLASKDVRGATAAFAGFERPSGFSLGNPEGAHNFMGRLNGANEALAKFGGKTSLAAEGLGKFGGGLDKFGNALSSVNLGGAGAGAGGFNWGSLFSGFTPNTTLGSFLTNGFRRGGATGGSDPGRVAGVVHEKEYVFDEAATSRIGVPVLEAIRRGTMRGFREGGYASVGRAYPTFRRDDQEGGIRSAGGITQHIHNYAGVPVTTEDSDDGRGGERQDVYIGKVVGRAIGQSGNPANQAVRQAFDVRPRMIRR